MQFLLGNYGQSEVNSKSFQSAYTAYKEVWFM